jgi:hypothetical protein
MTEVQRALRAGVRKPPREETAGDGVERFGARYGDLSAVDGAAERMQDDRGRWPTAMGRMSKQLPARTGEDSRTI